MKFQLVPVTSEIALRRESGFGAENVFDELGDDISLTSRLPNFTLIHLKEQMERRMTRVHGQVTRNILPADGFHSSSPPHPLYLPLHLADDIEHARQTSKYMKFQLVPVTHSAIGNCSSQGLGIWSRKRF
ncbi:hypothetical protein CEXT_553681 [Caerostris extrusa]|uniref:Uncharacterized protein n=1 Tax=Caerostris extrusa TaxID=172846 RepID=A0AAV4Q2J1_CAEEX|nr:hypothetical protein CEXT_553681 [Caerostris extrusa]